MLSWVVLDDRWKFVESKLLKVNFLASVIDVDAHQTPCSIVIENYPLGDLSAFDARLLRKIYVK